MQAIPNSLPDKDASYLHAGGVTTGAYDPKYGNPGGCCPGRQRLHRFCANRHAELSIAHKGGNMVFFKEGKHCTGR